MQLCPVRNKIMRRYDQELLGAPLWCTTQQEEGPWIQGVNVVVPQRAARELNCFSAHIRLRKPGKSEDKAECKIMDSRAMGLAAPWYRRGGTSVESSIPCSLGGRVLVVKGAEEVENVKTNFKY
ncbi:hypothetical protein BHM03_00008351 [Ensete ventricosum]|nr:hypothetical protein BHM03_00008351 [Ensete ventricosum]